LISNDINQGMLREDPSGSLWIGASGGISRLLHPERIFDPIPITAALTLSQRGTTDLSHLQKIVMKEAGPPLQLRVSSPAMQNRSELTLKIRMVGMNSDWLDTKDGVAGFARLRPGDYTFIGKACNPGINACSSEVALGVRVLPPWWNTYWFYAGCGLGVTILIFAGIRLYAYHLVQRSQELEQLVRERTEELEKSRELLRIQATHDGLTGMLNREAILKVLVEEIERGRRMARAFALALIDLDHFKWINDSRGHLAGDEALRVFSAAMANAIRPYDHIGRYGGEEFLIVLPDLPPDAAIQRLRTLHTTISDLPVGTAESAFNITCSVGAVTVIPTVEPMSTEPLLAIADQALYEAKAAGRNRIVTKTFDNISVCTTRVIPVREVVRLPAL
jgi:diguanylate cyclase (GGDEF)-like protein